MATLKVEVSKTAISRKGTCEVGIRLYHHHEKRLIETGIYVSKTEMTKKWTIRNELVKRKVKALLKDFNAKLKQLELSQTVLSVKEASRLSCIHHFRYLAFCPTPTIRHY